MKRLLLLCASLALLAIAVLAFVAAFELRGLRAQLLREIARQGDQTRDAAVLLGDVAITRSQHEIAATRRELARRVDTGTRLANERLEQTAEVLDRRTGQLLAAVDRRAGQIVQEIEQTNATVARVAKPAAELIEQVSEAAPLWLDCESNPSCAFNLYQGAAKAAQRSMQTIERSLPAMLLTAQKSNENMAGITADVHTLTGRFIAPKRWYVRVGTVMATGAIAAAKIAL